jgi:hypothetical protein
VQNRLRASESRVLSSGSSSRPRLTTTTTRGSFGFPTLTILHRLLEDIEAPSVWNPSAPFEDGRCRWNSAECRPVDQVSHRYIRRDCLEHHAAYTLVTATSNLSREGKASASAFLMRLCQVGGPESSSRHHLSVACEDLRRLVYAVWWCRWLQNVMDGVPAL